jgi:hypothetical protein
MNLETAKKLVAQKLPGYQVERTAQTDANEASRPLSAVEMVSPSLQKLKRRYFLKSKSAPKSSLIDSTEDSGIVVVEKDQGQGGEAKAMVFSRGQIKGRQG